MGGKSVGSKSVLRDTQDVSQGMVLPEIKAEIPKLGEELKNKFNDRLEKELTWYSDQVSRLAAKERRETDHGELKPNLDFKSLAAESTGMLQVLASRTETVWQERIEGLRKEFPAFLLDERRIAELVDGARKEGLRDEYLKYANEKGLSQDEKVRELTKIPEFSLREGELRHHLFSDELKETTNRLLEVSYEIGVYTSLSNQGDLESVAKHRSLQTERSTLRETMTRLMSEMPEDYPNRDKIVAGASQINAELGKLELAGMLKFRELSREKQQESLAEYNQKRKEGGALFAVKEIFDKAGDGKEHLMEWCSLLTIGSGYNLYGRITEGTYDRGAKYIQDQRERLNSSTKAGSMWGSDAEFSQMGDISVVVGVSPLGALRHVSDAVLQPGLELLDVGRIEAQRRAGSLGALAGEAYYGAEDSTGALSYTEYQEAEQSDGMLKTAKKSFEVAEIAASLALGKADTAGKLAGQMVMSGGMGAGSALSTQLMEMDDPNKNFDIARFVDESISNTAGSAVFSSGMRVFRGNNKVLNTVGEVVDKVDGWADFGSSLGNFDNVKGGYSLAGALTGLAVATTDVSDIKIGDKIGEKVDGFLVNRKKGSEGSKGDLGKLESEFEFKDSQKTVNTLSRVNVATENLIVEGREYEGYHSGNRKVFYVANKNDIPELYSSILKSRGEVDPNGSYDVTSFIDKKSGLIFSQMPAPNETEDVTKARSANLAHEDEHGEDLEAGREIDEERAYARASKYTDNAALTTYDENRYQDTKNLSLAASREDPRLGEFAQAIRDALHNKDSERLSNFKGIDLKQIGGVRGKGYLTPLLTGLSGLVSAGLPMNLRSAVYEASGKIKVFDRNEEDEKVEREILELHFTCETKEGIKETRTVIFDPDLVRYDNSYKYRENKFYAKEGRDNYQVAKFKREVEYAYTNKTEIDLDCIKIGDGKLDLISIGALSKYGVLNTSFTGLDGQIKPGFPELLKFALFNLSRVVSIYDRNERGEKSKRTVLEIDLDCGAKGEDNATVTMIFDPDLSAYDQDYSYNEQKYFVKEARENYQVAKLKREIEWAYRRKKEVDIDCVTLGELKVDLLSIGAITSMGVFNKSFTGLDNQIVAGLPVPLDAVILRQSRTVKIIDRDKQGNRLVREVLEIDLDCKIKGGKSGIYTVVFDPDLGAFFEAYKNKQNKYFAKSGQDNYQLVRLKREIELSLKNKRNVDVDFIRMGSGNVDFLSYSAVSSQGQFNLSFTGLTRQISAGLPGDLKSVIYEGSRIVRILDRNNRGEKVWREILEIEVRCKIGESSVENHTIIFDPDLIQYDTENENGDNRYFSKNDRKNYQVRRLRREIDYAYKYKMRLDLIVAGLLGWEIDLVLMGAVTGTSGMLNASLTGKGEGRAGLPNKVKSVNLIGSNFRNEALELRVLCEREDGKRDVRSIGFDGERFFKVGKGVDGISPLKGDVLDLLLFLYVMKNQGEGAQYKKRYLINEFTGEVREPNILLGDGTWLHAKWGPALQSVEYVNMLTRAARSVGIGSAIPLEFLIYRSDVAEVVRLYGEALCGEVGLSGDQIRVGSVLDYVLEKGLGEAERELLNQLGDVEDLSEDELKGKKEELEKEIDRATNEGVGQIDLSRRDAWEAHVDTFLNNYKLMKEGLYKVLENHSPFWNDKYHFHLVAYSAYVLKKLQDTSFSDDEKSEIVRLIYELYPDLKEVHDLNKVIEVMCNADQESGAVQVESGDESLGGKRKILPKKFELRQYIYFSADDAGARVGAEGDAGHLGAGYTSKHRIARISIEDNLGTYLRKIKEELAKEGRLSAKERHEILSSVSSRIENYLKLNIGAKFDKVDPRDKGSFESITIDQLTRVLSDLELSKESNLLGEIKERLRGGDLLAAKKGAIDPALLAEDKDLNAVRRERLKEHASMQVVREVEARVETTNTLSRRNVSLVNLEIDSKNFKGYYGKRANERSNFNVFYLTSQSDLEKLHSEISKTRRANSDSGDTAAFYDLETRTIYAVHPMAGESEAETKLRSSLLVHEVDHGEGQLNEVKAYVRQARFLDKNGYRMEFHADGYEVRRAKQGEAELNLEELRDSISTFVQSQYRREDGQGYSLLSASRDQQNYRLPKGSEALNRYSDWLANLDFGKEKIIGRYDEVFKSSPENTISRLHLSIKRVEEGKLGAEFEMINLSENPVMIEKEDGSRTILRIGQSSKFNYLSRVTFVSLRSNGEVEILNELRVAKEMARRYPLNSKNELRRGFKLEKTLEDYEIIKINNSDFQDKETQKVTLGHDVSSLPLGSYQMTQRESTDQGVNFRKYEQDGKIKHVIQPSNKETCTLAAVNMLALDGILGAQQARSSIWYNRFLDQVLPFRKRRYKRSTDNIFLTSLYENVSVPKGDVYAAANSELAKYGLEIKTVNPVSLLDLNEAGLMRFSELHGPIILNIPGRSHSVSPIIIDKVFYVPDLECNVATIRDPYHLWSVDVSVPYLLERFEKRLHISDISKYSLAYVGRVKDKETLSEIDYDYLYEKSRRAYQTRRVDINTEFHALNSFARSPQMASRLAEFVCRRLDDSGLKLDEEITRIIDEEIDFLPKLEKILLLSDQWQEEFIQSIWTESQDLKNSDGNTIKELLLDGEIDEVKADILAMVVETRVSKVRKELNRLTGDNLRNISDEKLFKLVSSRLNKLRDVISTSKDIVQEEVVVLNDIVALIAQAKGLSMKSINPEFLGPCLMIWTKDTEDSLNKLMALNPEISDFYADPLSDIKGKANIIEDGEVRIDVRDFFLTDYYPSISDLFFDVNTREERKNWEHTIFNGEVLLNTGRGKVGNDRASKLHLSRLIYLARDMVELEAKMSQRQEFDEIHVYLTQIWNKRLGEFKGLIQTLSTKVFEEDVRKTIYAEYSGSAGLDKQLKEFLIEIGGILRSDVTGKEFGEKLVAKVDQYIGINNNGTRTLDNDNRDGHVLSYSDVDPYVALREMDLSDPSKVAQAICRDYFLNTMDWIKSEQSRFYLLNDSEYESQRGDFETERLRRVKEFSILVGDAFKANGIVVEPREIESGSGIYEYYIVPGDQSWLNKYAKRQFNSKGIKFTFNPQAHIEKRGMRAGYHHESLTTDLPLASVLEDKNNEFLSHEKIHGVTRNMQSRGGVGSYSGTFMMIGKDKYNSYDGYIAIDELLPPLNIFLSDDGSAFSTLREMAIRVNYFSGALKKVLSKDTTHLSYEVIENSGKHGESVIEVEFYEKDKLVKFTLCEESILRDLLEVVSAELGVVDLDLLRALEREIVARILAGRLHDLYDLSTQVIEIGKTPTRSQLVNIKELLFAEVIRPLPKVLDLDPEDVLVGAINDLYPAYNHLNEIDLSSPDKTAQANCRAKFQEIYYWRITEEKRIKHLVGSEQYEARRLHKEEVKKKAAEFSFYVEASLRANNIEFEKFERISGSGIYVFKIGREGGSWLNQFAKRQWGSDKRPEQVRSISLIFDPLLVIEDYTTKGTYTHENRLISLPLMSVLLDGPNTFLSHEKIHAVIRHMQERGGVGTLSGEFHDISDKGNSGYDQFIANDELLAGADTESKVNDSQKGVLRKNAYRIQDSARHFIYSIDKQIDDLQYTVEQTDNNSELIVLECYSHGKLAKYYLCENKVFQEQLRVVVSELNIDDPILVKALERELVTDLFRARLEDAKHLALDIFKLGPKPSKSDLAKIRIDLNTHVLRPMPAHFKLNSKELLESAKSRVDSPFFDSDLEELAKKYKGKISEEHFASILGSLNRQHPESLSVENFDPKQGREYIQVLSDLATLESMPVPEWHKLSSIVRHLRNFDGVGDQELENFIVKMSKGYIRKGEIYELSLMLNDEIFSDQLKTSRELGIVLREAVNSLSIQQPNEYLHFYRTLNDSIEQDGAVWEELASEQFFIDLLQTCHTKPSLGVYDYLKEILCELGWTDEKLEISPSWIIKTGRDISSETGDPDEVEDYYLAESIFRERCNYSKFERKALKESDKKDKVSRRGSRDVIRSEFSLDSWEGGGSKLLDSIAPELSEKERLEQDYQYVIERLAGLRLHELPSLPAEDSQDEDEDFLIQEALEKLRLIGEEVRVRTQAIETYRGEDSVSNEEFFGKVNEILEEARQSYELAEEMAFDGVQRDSHVQVYNNLRFLADELNKIPALVATKTSKAKLPDNIGVIENNVEILANRLGIAVENITLLEKAELIEDEVYARVNKLDARIRFVKGNINKISVDKKLRSIKERVSRYSDNFEMLGDPLFSEALLGRALLQETEKVLGGVDRLLSLERAIEKLEGRQVKKAEIPAIFRKVLEAEEFGLDVRTRINDSIEKEVGVQFIQDQVGDRSSTNYGIVPDSEGESIIANILFANEYEGSANNILVFFSKVLQKDGKVINPFRRIEDRLDITGKIRHGRATNLDLVIECLDFKEAEFIGCPRDLELECVVFYDANGFQLENTVKIYKNLDGSIEFGHYPAAAAIMIVGYTRKQSFISNRDKRIKESLKNVPAHSAVISPEMRRVLESIDQEMSEEEKVALVCGAFFASNLVYTNDENISKILDTLNPELVPSFLNGLGCGNCETLTMQLHNLLSIVGIHSVSEGGPDRSKDGATYGVPGHGYLRVYLKDKTITIDSTLHADRSLAIQVPDSAVSTASPRSKLDAYKLGKELRDRYVRNVDIDAVENTVGVNTDDFSTLPEIKDSIKLGLQAEELARDLVRAVDARDVSAFSLSMNKFRGIYPELLKNTDKKEELDILHKAIGYLLSDREFHRLSEFNPCAFLWSNHPHQSFSGVCMLNDVNDRDYFQFILEAAILGSLPKTESENEKEILKVFVENIYQTLVYDSARLLANATPEFQVQEVKCIIDFIFYAEKELQDKTIFDKFKPILMNLAISLEQPELLIGNESLRPASDSYRLLMEVIVPAKGVDPSTIDKKEVLDSYVPQNIGNQSLFDLVELMELLPGEPASIREDITHRFVDYFKEGEIITKYSDPDQFEGEQPYPIRINDPLVRLYFELLDSNLHGSYKGDFKQKVCIRAVRYARMGYLDLSSLEVKGLDSEPWSHEFWSMLLGHSLFDGLNNLNINSLPVQIQRRFALRDVAMVASGTLSGLQLGFGKALVAPFMDDEVVSALKAEIDHQLKYQEEVYGINEGSSDHTSYKQYLIKKANQIAASEEFASKYSDIAKNSFLYFNNLMNKLPRDARDAVLKDLEKAFDDAYLSQWNNLNLHDLMVAAFPEYGVETSEVHRSALQLLMLEGMKDFADKKHNNDPRLIRPNYEGGSWLSNENQSKNERENDGSMSPFHFEVNKDPLTEFSIQLAMKVTSDDSLTNGEGEDVTDVQARLRRDVATSTLRLGSGSKEFLGRGVISRGGKNSTYDASRRTLHRTGEYNGTREAVPGDPFKSIDQRASARRGKLVVREYHPEVDQSSGSAVEILIDARSLYGPKDDQKVINIYRRLQEKIVELRSAKKSVTVSVLLNGRVRHWDAATLDDAYNKSTVDQDAIPGEDFFVALDDFRKHMIFVRPDSIEGKILFASKGNFIRAIPKKNPSYEAKSGKINANSIKYIILSDEESGREAVHFLETNLPVPGIEIEHIVCSEGLKED